MKDGKITYKIIILSKRLFLHAMPRYVKSGLKGCGREFANDRQKWLNNITVINFKILKFIPLNQYWEPLLRVFETFRIKFQM